MRVALVTGGAGFIGSHLVRSLLADGWCVVNLDALNYAGDPRNLEADWGHDGHRFVHGNLANRELIGRLLSAHAPEVVYHLAAESHVTRAIYSPGRFLTTNVLGTLAVLEELRISDPRVRPRLVHVSTDEIYGSLAAAQPPFTEVCAANPSGPYAASKSAADGYARAYARTYGLDVVVARPGNNFGPAQHVEKLIPQVIACAVRGAPFPMHGLGTGTRDWLSVQDCVAALRTLAERGKSGEAYGVSAAHIRSPLQIVEALGALLDARGIRPPRVEHVPERPANDTHYATDCSKLRQLGWTPSCTFDGALARTVDWYLKNRWALEHRGEGPGDRLPSGFDLRWLLDEQESEPS